MSGQQGVAGYYLELHEREMFDRLLIGGDAPWVREQCGTWRAAGFEVVMRTRPNQFGMMRAILILWKVGW